MKNNTKELIGKLTFIQQSHKIWGWAWQLAAPMCRHLKLLDWNLNLHGEKSYRHGGI